MTKVAAVLGAGIQGCCAALALSKLGFQVRLYDKSSVLMNRASANQEGKIHLGFVYARDASMITARKMIEHAMQFAPAIESLVGAALYWEPHLSERFYCGIHRDSSLTLQEHFAHFNALQNIYEEVSDNKDTNYLGRRLTRVWKEATTFQFAGSSMIHAVQSEETAVDVTWMRSVIVNVIEDDPKIMSFAGHIVTHVERTGQSFVVRGAHLNDTWQMTADIVVNCLWEGAQKIDNQMQGNHSTDWLTRVKYGFVLDSIPELRHLPSLIITHGPFGDIVNFPSDNSIYVTWYPSCLAYIGKTEQLSEEWEAVCEGIHPAGLAEQVFKESIDKLSEYVPELRYLKLRQVMAGSIVGHGKSDISDHESGLHKRHGIGVNVTDDYFSIFTGKYTSGPANAMELMNLLS